LQEHFVQASSINISFDYPSHYNKTKTFTYYILVKPDLSFELSKPIENEGQPNEDGILKTTTGYKFKVQSGTQFADISDGSAVKTWLSKYFNIHANIEGIELSVNSGANYIENNGENYCFVDKYADSNTLHVITFNSMEFVVGGKTYATNIVIEVEIEPEYRLTTSSTNTIMDGTQLYDNVIQLKDADNQNISDISKFADLEIDIVKQVGLDANGVTISDGIVKLNFTQSDDAKITINVKYKDVILIQNLTITIEGVQVDYSTIGNKANGATSTLSNNIEISVEKGTFNVDKYFNASFDSQDSSLNLITIVPWVEQIENTNVYDICYKTKDGVIIKTGYK
jgi:hypothetical protein